MDAGRTRIAHGHDPQRQRHTGGWQRARARTHASALSRQGFLAALREAFVEFYRHIRLLQGFAALNYTALSKLCKRHGTSHALVSGIRSTTATAETALRMERIAYGTGLP